MARVLVTGGSGFIGRELTAFLALRGHDVVAISRRMPSLAAQTRTHWYQCDLCEPDTLPAEAWDGVDAVIHVAAIAHVPKDRSHRNLKRLMATNVAATGRLAQQAASRGVGRFVFVSSAAIHGSRSNGVRFREDHEPAPDTPYAISKVRAEKILWAVAADCGLEVAIVRPPLVYGPGARGNFPRLLHWASEGHPLPRAALKNTRSFIGLRNLCQFLEQTVRHPAAVGETFLVSDDEDISTGEFFRRVGLALGRPARFVSLPRPLIAAALLATGRSATIDRLFGDFLIDCSKAKTLLGWRPAVSMEDEIKHAAERFRNERLA